MGKFSRRQMDELFFFLLFFFFFLFSRKQDLTFHANIDSGDNLHECYNLFSGKSKKTISMCRLLKFLSRATVLSINPEFHVINVYCSAVTESTIRL